VTELLFNAYQATVLPPRRTDTGRLVGHETCHHAAHGLDCDAYERALTTAAGWGASSRAKPDGADEEPIRLLAHMGPEEVVQGLDNLRRAVRAWQAHRPIDGNSVSDAVEGLGVAAEAIAANLTEFSTPECVTRLEEILIGLNSTLAAVGQILDWCVDVCDTDSEIFAYPSFSSLARAAIDMADGTPRAWAADMNDPQPLRAQYADMLRRKATAVKQSANLVDHSFVMFMPPPRLQEPSDKATEVTNTALYRWYDAEGVLLYIGITDQLSARHRSHAKKSSWSDFAASSTVERFPTREAALDGERLAIQEERPLFNHVHNDAPDAQQRLVEYLVRHDRLDLLAPAVSRG
jgi:hypothetical protein